MMIQDKKIDGRIIGGISVLLFFIVWQALSQLNFINPLFFGTPTKILLEGIDLFRSGEIYVDLFSSLSAFFVGFIWAIAFGVVGGIIIGTNNRVYHFFKPYIFAANTVPPIVLLPLIIIWFGIGSVGKTIIVFFMAVTPILLNTSDAARNVDRSLLEMAKSFGAKQLFILKNITFFHSLPYIFSAIRVSTGRAIVGVIIAEFFGFGQGIGYLISFYSSSFRIDRAMALVFMVIIFNSVIVSLINLAEKR